MALHINAAVLKKIDCRLLLILYITAIPLSWKAHLKDLYYEGDCFFFFLAR